MAYWTPSNLDLHYSKHPAGRDEKCWMELLGQTRQVKKEEYEIESKKVVTTSWIQYCAEALDIDAWWDAKANPDPPFHKKARYYTDERLVLTVTNVNNHEIRTCYHEHFDRGHHPGSGSLKSLVEITEAKLRYVNHLNHKRKGLQLRKMTVERTKAGLPLHISLIIAELKS